MCKRNIYFLIALCVYLFLAVYFILKYNDVSMAIKVFLIFGAIILALLNVFPSLKKKTTTENTVEVVNPFLENNCEKNYLILTNEYEKFQFFIYNSTYVFKRLKNDSDLVDNIENFRFSNLKKQDISIPFSSIKNVVFNDNMEIYQSGELIFRCNKKLSFYILGLVEQETIDSYFKNVKFIKKSYRDKQDNSNRLYSKNKRQKLADLAFLSKLMIPFSVVAVLFSYVTNKSVDYYIFSIVGIVGFVLAAYVCVNHLLIVFPNPKGDKDDIDIIGDGVIINMIFIVPYIWELYTTVFENPLYSYLIIGVPTVIVTFSCFLKNMPKTELEKIYRVCSVAVAVISIILFANSAYYTDIKAEYGTVIEIFEKNSNDDTDIYQIMKPNGERFEYYFGSFEKDDTVKIEYKKGLLGMKIADVRVEKE